MSRGDDTVLRSPAHPPHFSPETTSREAQVRGHGELEINNPEEERVTLGCPQRQVDLVSVGAIIHAAT